jgi:hypothetical protein
VIIGGSQLNISTTSESPIAASISPRSLINPGLEIEARIGQFWLTDLLYGARLAYQRSFDE